MFLKGKKDQYIILILNEKNQQEDAKNKVVQSFNEKCVHVLGLMMLDSKCHFLASRFEFMLNAKMRFKNSTKKKKCPQLKPQSHSARASL